MKRILIMIGLIFAFQAKAFDYFSGEINYWEKGVVLPIRKEPPKESIPTKIEKTVEKSFDWTKYKDPKNKEFFKEGEHTPPEPFMELARNPSNENIKNWFQLIEAKNELMGNLSRRMAEYTAKNSSALTQEETELITQKIEKTKHKEIDFKRFRFRLYFDSTCPHCKNMMVSMNELQEKGFYVEVKQIDAKRPDFPVPFVVIPATEAELKDKKITSWPVLFVADTDKKLIYRINGYLSTQDILRQLSVK